MSTQVCNPCAEVPVCVEGLEKYSLQDDLYFTVINCPPNVYCGGPQRIFLACCDGTTMQQDFPQGITQARRTQLINDLVAKCERRILFCDTPPPPPPGTDEYFYSAPASCTVTCPDGTPFTYTVPAGVFISKSLADATAAAKQYACLRAPEFRICLGPFNACWCADTFQRAIIAIDSANPPFKVAFISGSFPIGLSLTTQGNSVVISGAATTPGDYVFALQVTDPFGNAARRTYRISIIEITTNALTNFNIGSPYSFQLSAAGGSGNFAWRLVSGTLPPGLELSTSGLISGTPTADGGGSLVFEVIDQSCEAVSRRFFPGRVSLVTNSTTTLKIKRGYPEYILFDGTLYKKITWSGQISQRAYSLGIQVAGAQYIYSGSTEIDAFGRFIDHHTKNLSVQCQKDIYPIIGGFFSELTPAQVTRLLGYCYDQDPNSCSTCPTNEEDWIFDGDFQTGSPTDPPLQMVTSDANVYEDPTNYEYLGTATDSVTGIEGVANFPGLVIGGSGIVIQAPTIELNSDGNFSAVLSDPYTDADAEASKQVITGKMPTAENRPDYLRAAGQQFLTLIYSRVTQVAYTIKCSNLISGQFYLVRYQLVDSDGTTSTVSNESQTFLASSQTHVISGVVPTPDVNHTKTIRNVTIAFV